MSTPIQLDLTPEQREMFASLQAEIERAERDINVFCATVFRGIGAKVVRNVQMVDGKLVGEIPEQGQ